MRLLVLLLALATIAQSAPQSPSAAQQPSSGDNYGVPQAPKPGHPLDPNDVATLTGKNNSAAQPQQTYATPQIYYSYPTGSSMFTQSSVGNAFIGQPAYGVASNPYGTAFGNSGFMCWNAPTYGAYGTGSQFANVTTSSNPFFFRGIRKPGFAPTFFFGNRRPGFGVNRWGPHLWTGGSKHSPAATAPKSSPGLRP